MPTIDVNDGYLHYEEAGRGTAVVFAHGGGGDLSQWRHQMPEFARHHRVVAYDARGHGRSSPARACGVATWVGDLLALLQRLEIARAHLVGATLGGIAVLEFTLAYPSKVSTLALVSTAPDTNDEMRSRFGASAEIVESGDMKAFAEGFVGFIFSPEYVARNEGEVAEFRRRLESIDPVSYAAAIRALGDRPDLSPRLGAIAQPALIVTGEIDPIPTSAPGAEVLARALPSARRRVITGAAHLPQIERPGEFNREVLEFIAEAERAAA